ncbi:MAG: hypothetical protein KDD15_28865, partial [Lewinella sp.]|nr:hypothetical protein [Lewinella sp.]
MNNMNDRSVKFEKQDWQLATVLLVALLLALGAHLLTLQTLEELEEAGKELMGVYDGTESLRSLDRHLIELVHAQTNYMESGEVILVGKGEDAVRDIEQDLGKIKSYFQNEMTSPYLKKLEDFVRQKIIYHRNIMGAVQQNQPVEEAKMQFLAEGEQLRDSILEMTDTIRHYHRQHMLNYLNRKNDLSNKLLMVSLGSVIFVFLIAVFSIYYLMRTARRRRELLNNLVEAKENAERAAFLKEQFVANMSHEIRTPLNAIIGFANLLNRTSLKENQPEFVHSIRTSSENLLSIINDILDFSKIEAGALRLEYISFNLSALLHSIENMFLYREKNSPVKFYLHIDDKLPDSLKGDPTRLTQILVNLLGNAFKFTEEGRIDLSVKRQADLEEDKLLVSFEVRDTGIGISAGKLENIFDRFAQAASDTTRKYGGAGLGLTITKQLVEVQGGSIRVESEEGKGATFTVVIPFGIAADAQNRGPRTDLSDALSESGTTSILLVEDNPMNQRVAELLLDGWGFSHEHAINGREA